MPKDWYNRIPPKLRLGKKMDKKVLEIHRAFTNYEQAVKKVIDAKNEAKNYQSRLERFDRGEPDIRPREGWSRKRTREYLAGNLERQRREVTTNAKAAIRHRERLREAMRENSKG